MSGYARDLSGPEGASERLGLLT